MILNRTQSASNVKSAITSNQKTPLIANPQSNQPRKSEFNYTISRQSFQLKHRKLFQGAIKKNFLGVRTSGYVYHDDRDINIKDQKGNCPLYYCTLNQDVPFIDWLLSKRANVNFICKNGNTPLHIAFKKNNEEIVLKFLAKGGDISKINQDGFTPPGLASKEFLQRIGMPDAIVFNTNKYGNTEVDNNSFWKADIRLNNKEIQEQELWMFSEPLQYEPKAFDDPNGELRMIDPVNKVPTLIHYKPPPERRIDQLKDEKRIEVVQQILNSQKQRDELVKPKRRQAY